MSLQKNSTVMRQFASEAAKSSPAEKFAIQRASVMMLTMEHVEEFIDQRQRSWCIHCGGWIGGLAKSRDHVPTKALLREPFPTNVPVVQVCKSCNEGFSRDEEYLAAFLGCVLSGSTQPEAQASPTAWRILRANEKLRARIERSKSSYRTLGGQTRHVWKPERARVERVILKNSRGHALFECGEPMLRAPDHVLCFPLLSLTKTERDEFEDAETGSLWPEVGSRMMTRWVTGQDLSGGWVIVQEGAYRYSVAQNGGLRVRIVISEYLAAEVLWN